VVRTLFGDALIAVLAKLPALATAAQQPSAARPVLGRAVFEADPARLAQVLAQSGVERRPQPPPGSYLADVVGAAARWIMAALGRGVMGVPGWAVRFFAFAVLALALGLAVTAGWRAWRGGRRAASAGANLELSPALPGGEAAWDAAAWRRHRDRALAEGRLAEALRATWWWLARSLAGSRAEPTWTGRDLLAAAGRTDLRPLVAGLDALVYGPQRCDGAAANRALRRLIGELEEVLA
jgi:hypothetical protein